MEAILKYDRVELSYLGQPVVQDVSFSLEPGEILGIVGESGSGKSTLIKAAMGLLGSEGCVTKGQICYRGRNLLGLSSKELRKLNGPELGYIFQNAGSAFCPIRTVGAQLYETMRAHGKISRAEFGPQALEMLEKLGFENGERILASYPFELSGGMQQRIGIAAAMLLRPSVLLADEPTSALDPISTSKIEELATELKKRYTIVIVTHNMQQALRISDNTAFFLLGELVEYGDTETMFSTPREKRTEDYITGRFG